MNRKEIINLLALATANFPSYQERDMQPTAVLWEKALADIPYEIAEQALLKVLSTSRFFPTIADIREAVADITQPRTMDWSEAWHLIGQAIRKYGFYREQEALESLPDDVRTMVERFSWRELCLNEEPDILRAQFRMAWETQSKRIKEYNALPAPLREMIDGLSNNMKLLGNGEQVDKCS